MVNKFQSGDVVFDWRLCYEFPSLADPRHLPPLQRILAMRDAKESLDRWVPVPGVDQWDSWLVLYTMNDMTTLVPVLWHDLGHFKHLNAIRESEGCDAYPIMFRKPWKGMALLGFSHTVTPEDLHHGLAEQRRLSPETAIKLRQTFASMLACNDGESKCRYLVSMRYEKCRIYYQLNGSWGSRRTACLNGLWAARKIADGFSADIELHDPIPPRKDKL